MTHVQHGTPHGIATYSRRSCELANSTCFGYRSSTVKTKYRYYNRNLTQILQNKTIPQNFCVSMETAKAAEPVQLCHGLRASTVRQPSLKFIMFKMGEV